MDSTLQNLANIAVLASAIFVGFQIRLYIREFNLKNNRARIEKAIDLATLYANDILEKISLIDFVFKSLKLNEIIDKVDHSSMIDFDVDEMNKLFNKQDIETINSTLKSKEFGQTWTLAKTVILSNKERTSFDKIRDLVGNMPYIKPSSIAEEVASTGEVASTEKAYEVLDDINNKFLVQEFSNLVSDVLNQLEYFSMYFNSEIADEEAVYQSLQQSFRSIVKLLYFRISRINKDNKDKYYTNIIELYSKWNNRYIENCIKEEELKKSLVLKAKKVQ